MLFSVRVENYRMNQCVQIYQLKYDNKTYDMSVEVRKIDKNV